MPTEVSSSVEHLCSVNVLHCTHTSRQNIAHPTSLISTHVQHTQSDFAKYIMKIIMKMNEGK